MAAKKIVNDDSNASDFIRSQPLGMTAPDVVHAGKKAGFDFSNSLVYAVRGRMKKGGGGGAAKKEAAPARRQAPTSVAVRPPQMEEEVRALVDDFIAKLSVIVRRAALEAVKQALRG